MKTPNMHFKSNAENRGGTEIQAWNHPSAPGRQPAGESQVATQVSPGPARCQRKRAPGPLCAHSKMLNPSLSGSQPMPMEGEVLVLSRRGISFSAKSGRCAWQHARQPWGLPDP